MYNKLCEMLICNVNFKNNHMDNPVCIFSQSQLMKFSLALHLVVLIFECCS
jgi:hypothetical protein